VCNEDYTRAEVVNLPKPVNWRYQAITLKIPRPEGVVSRDFECNGLIYIRGCQEHFSPSTGAQYGSRRPALSPMEDAGLVSCLQALVVPISAMTSSLMVTTPISFETEQALRLYGVNHGSI
jgi:hypothetical protein